MLSLLTLAAAALGWDVVAEPLIEASGPVTGVMMVRIDTLSLVVVGTPDHTELLTRDGYLVAHVDRGWHDYALVDADRDASKELVLCGDQGIVVVEPLDFTTWLGSDEPCDDIEAVIDPHHGEVLAVASGWVRLLRPTEEGLEDVGVVANGVGRIHLAASGDRWAWADEGTRTVSTVGAEPMRWTLPEPPTDLISGPLGFSWSLSRSGQIEDEGGVRWPVGGAPTVLRAAHMDRDDTIDLIAMHPSLNAVSVTSGRGGGTELYRLQSTPTALHHRDVDGDGCDDVLIGYADPPGVQILRTATCSRRSVVHSDGVSAPGVPEAQRITSLMGVHVPPFHRSSQLLPRESRPYRELLFGSGLAMGGALRDTTVQIPVFPTLSAGLRFGGPRIRGYVGGDSAALFFWASEETRGIRLANLTVGVTAGSPRLRVGPLLTAGVWNVGAGVRAVWTPWTDNDNRTHGVELRLTGLYPRTGEVMLMYVWARPEESQRSQTPYVLGFRPVAEDGERVANARPSTFDATPLKGTHRVSLGIGAALGPSSTDSNWSWVAPESQVRWSASPVFAAQYEVFRRGVSWFVGAETAPLFSHQGRRGRQHYHLGSYSMGVSVGSRHLRLGPMASAGFWVLGAGARGWVELGTTPNGTVHGLEVRAQALLPELRAGQAMLVWSMGFDPRR